MSSNPIEFMKAYQYLWQTEESGNNPGDCGDNSFCEYTRNTIDIIDTDISDNSANSLQDSANSFASLYGSTIDESYINALNITTTNRFDNSYTDLTALSTAADKLNAKFIDNADNIKNQSSTNITYKKNQEKIRNNILSLELQRKEYNETISRNILFYVLFIIFIIILIIIVYKLLKKN